MFVINIASNAEVVQDVQNFRERSTRPPYREYRKEDVPHEQRPLQDKSRSTAHPGFNAVNRNHISGDIVEGCFPIFPKPHSLCPQVELRLELEDIGVVGHQVGLVVVEGK